MALGDKKNAQWVWIDSYEDLESVSPLLHWFHINISNNLSVMKYSMGVGFNELPLHNTHQYQYFTFFWPWDTNNYYIAHQTVAIKTYRVFQHYCTNWMSISQIVLRPLNIQNVSLLYNHPVYICIYRYMYICIYIYI